VHRAAGGRNSKQTSKHTHQLLLLLTCPPPFLCQLSNATLHSASNKTANKRNKQEQTDQQTTYTRKSHQAAIGIQQKVQDQPQT
jgi:hypothetical protein